MLYIKTTPAFDRKAKKLLSEEALEELLDFLTDHPETGSIISGTAGVRKLRWKTGKSNRGKSGGVRILYHYSKNVLILLITLYAKSKQENISEAECNLLKQTIPELVEKYRGNLCEETKH